MFSILPYLPLISGELSYYFSENTILPRSITEAACHGVVKVFWSSSIATVRASHITGIAFIFLAEDWVFHLMYKAWKMPLSYGTSIIYQPKHWFNEAMNHFTASLIYASITNRSGQNTMRGQFSLQFTIFAKKCGTFSVNMVNLRGWFLSKCLPFIFQLFLWPIFQIIWSS